VLLGAIEKTMVKQITSRKGKHKNKAARSVGRLYNSDGPLTTSIAISEEEHSTIPSPTHLLAHTSLFKT